MKRAILLIPFTFFLCMASAQLIPIDSAMPLIAKEKNDSIRARLVWYTLGTSETNPVYDMIISEKLLVQSRKNKDKVEEVFSLSCMGYDYRAFGDNTKSLKYDLESLAVAEQTDNKEAKAMAHMCLAFNYHDLGEYRKAIELNLKAVDYASKAYFHEVQTYGLLGLGETYLAMNKIDSALIYAQEAYSLASKAKYTDLMSMNLNLLGNIHAKMNHAGLAENYFDMAIQEAYKLGSAKQVSDAYNAKAEYFHDKGQVDSAMDYAKKAIAAVQHTAFSTMCINPSRLLLDIYRTKNVDSAFKYSEIFRSANDSLFNTRAVQTAQLMTFEEDARQQQLLLERSKADEERRLNIQYILIALGIVTFLIFFLMLSRSFIINTKQVEFLGIIALLIVFEFLNLLFHPFIERITDHSPVLMLIILVCIAAILVPLHHRIEKWATAKLVEKNKRVRLAMAKRTIEKLEGPASNN